MQFDFSTDVQDETIPVFRIDLKAGPRKPGAPELNINREALTVDNVIVAEVGEAKGHGFEIEPSFLTELNGYIKKKMAGRVQCNMGHNWNNMMRQLGKFSNIRLSDDGKTLLGKLQLYKASDTSPIYPGMGKWFLDIAEEDPQSVMCSISFAASGFYQYDKHGQKVYVQTDWWGEPIPQDADKPVYCEFGELYSIDIVDEGALTSTLFSAGHDSAAASFLKHLTSTPGFAEWLQAHATDFPQLQLNLPASPAKAPPEMSIIKNLLALFKKSTMSETQNAPQSPTDVTTKDTPSTTPAPTQNLAAAEAPAGADGGETIAELRQQLAAVTTQLREQQELIKQLGAQPAATPTPIKLDDTTRIEASEDDKPYLKNPINQKARDIAASMGKA